MIDIHSHILPRVDDGSDSVEQSHALLSMLWEQGVTAVAATPHFYASQDTPKEFLSRRQAALDQLVPDPETMPQIILGAEVQYFDGMSHSEELTGLQLGNSGLLLVEMPFTQWTDRMVAEVCNLPAQLGLTAVLAHIDRYRDAGQLQKYRRQLLDSGVLFQCNADAFLMGLKSRWAFQMLRRGQIHFLGSDCHNLTTRPPHLSQAAELIAKKTGKTALDSLTAFAEDALLLCE